MTVSSSAIKFINNDLYDIKETLSTNAKKTNITSEVSKEKVS